MHTIFYLSKTKHNSCQSTLDKGKISKQNSAIMGNVATFDFDKLNIKGDLQGSLSSESQSEKYKRKIKDWSNPITIFDDLKVAKNIQNILREIK